MSDWTQETVLGTARNFMEPRVLLTAAELDLFGLLAGNPLTAEEVAGRLSADLRGTTVLLDAAAAMGLLSKADGRYSAPAEIIALLTADGERTVLPMVLHAAGLWRRWSRLTEVVLGPNASGPVGPFASEDAQTRAFIGAMHVVGAALAPAVVARIGVGRARRLLDVGGASGTYTIAFLRASPDLRATLFDRPQVVGMAEERLRAEGLLDRVTIVPGDFYSDPLPGGHDLVLLSAIVHQNSREQNVALFRSCLQATTPGGRIVVRDHVMSPDRTRPKSGALFAVNMLVGTEGGGTYTFDELRDDLEAAGYVRVRLMEPDERMNGLVEAFRP
jgi:predicted O-methyltransferase YrrM